MCNKFAALACAALLAGSAFAAAPSASAQPGSAAIASVASSDSGKSYGTSDTCAQASYGWFAHDDDYTVISDICRDGWSAVLEVDEQPTGDYDHYDYTVWDNAGFGTWIPHYHDITEGHTVCVRAAIGHPSTNVIKGFGSWKCGTS